MSHESFLPEDYLAQRAERRTNVISITLFVVVVTAVFGAFLVTNRQWSQVKQSQKVINTQYQEAARRIEKLSELEAQKEQMLNKAELIASLVERTPRSIITAELVNRMPNRLSLLSFKLESEKLKPKRPALSKDPKRLKGKAQRAKTKEEAAAEQQKIRPPRYMVKVEMVGVAPTDIEVSRYMAALQEYNLLTRVRLEYSEEKKVDERYMREFKINLQFDPDADVRDVEPLIVPRDMNNPMSDKLEFISPTKDTAAVFEPNEDGD